MGSYWWVLLAGTILPIRQICCIQGLGWTFYVYFSSRCLCESFKSFRVYLLRNRQQSINESDGLGELGLVGPWVMKMIRRAAGRWPRLAAAAAAAHTHPRGEAITATDSFLLHFQHPAASYRPLFDAVDSHHLSTRFYVLICFYSSLVTTLDPWSLNFLLFLDPQLIFGPICSKKKL